jgi:thioesterase domain-containing protein
MRGCKTHATTVQSHDASSRALLRGADACRRCESRERDALDVPTDCARREPRCPKFGQIPACDTRAVKSLATLATELQATWHREIPLAAAMEVQIASCTAAELVVRAPLAPNRNVHGTAFAGSLFSLCALTGWGMTWVAWQQRSSGGVIVLAESRIEFRKAVAGELLCRCTAEPAALDAALAAFAATGRAKLPLACTIDADEKRAVTFEGEYAVHARHGR